MFYSHLTLYSVGGETEEEGGETSGQPETARRRGGPAGETLCNIGGIKTTQTAVCIKKILILNGFIVTSFVGCF